MSNDSLSRFGDTCCRIKYQLKFYFTILNIINDYSEISIDQLWNIVNNDILNHNDIGLINHKKFITKQLKRFQIIEVKNNFCYLTDLGKNFFNVFKNKELANLNFDIVGVSWFYLMINSDIKLSKNFKGFVDKIIDMNNSVDEYILRFILSTDSFNENAEMDIYNFTNEDYDKMIGNKSIQIVAKRKKKLSIDYSLPNLISILENNEMINHVLDNDKNLYKKLKSMCKLYLNESKKINDNELREYIIKRGKYLINDAISLAQYNTINKDYFDINKRWFTECLLLIKKDGKLFVNDDYRQIYKELLNVKFDNELKNFYDFLLKVNINTTKKKLPYSKNEIINMLELAYQGKWLDLKNKYSLDNVNNATIFEYIVNITFFISFDKEISDIKKYCKTLLDDELKPYCHAPGGVADGSMLLNNYYVTIESTIIDQLESIIKNEKTSIQRHSVNYYNDIIKKINDYNEIPITIFVLQKNIDDKLVYNFCTENNSIYFDNPDIKIKIILLSCNDIANLWKMDSLNKIESIFDKLPLVDKGLISTFNDYKKIIKSAINH